MKITLLLATILILQEAHGFNRLDTVANWQIYYDTQLITAGHEPNTRTPDIGTIVIRNDPQKLKILYHYDAIKPKWRTIEIKSGTKTLYKETQHLKDNHPALIDLKELIKNKKGILEVQIYYTDDILTGKDRLIGKIKIEIR